MVKLSDIESQLKTAGCSIRFWGRAELRELCHVLLAGEQIHMAVNGQYEAGFALLVATDFRVLLVDKKPSKYLTLKDIRFDMITELDYSNRLLNSTIRIYTPNRELRFTSVNTVRLRSLFTYTQQKVMEIRNRFLMQQFEQQHLAKNTPPGLALTMQHYNAQALQAMYRPELPAAAVPETAMLPAPGQNWYGYSSYSDNNGVSAAGTVDEHRRLAAAVGAAGLRTIVHAIPFTQRWRKRPYGYMRTPLQPSSV